MSLASLIGENIWLLVILVLIVIVVSVEMGAVSKLKDMLNNALNGLEAYFQNLFQFYDVGVVLGSIASHPLVFSAST